MARVLKVVGLLLLLASVTSVHARDSDPHHFWRLSDSLWHLPPHLRFYELGRRGYTSQSLFSGADTGIGLRLVGKWGAGQSVDVTGRESLVFLSRGSEVVVIDFNAAGNFSVLAHIQVMGIVTRSVLVGNRLYVGTIGGGLGGVYVFDVSDAAHPVRLGSVSTQLYDLDVKDSLVFTTFAAAFQVFNFADPANPRLVGFCVDSGFQVRVNNGYAYLAGRWGLYILDVRDPTRPGRIASWGNNGFSIGVRGNICCVSCEDYNEPGEFTFFILDITDPAHPNPLSVIDSCGGYEIYLADSLVFLSGYYTGGHEFRILSIRDSTHPRTLGWCRTPGDNFGVWAAPSKRLGFVADWDRGLAVIDIHNLGAPVLDTLLLPASSSRDVAVSGNYLYVANSLSMKVLDISDPGLPREVAAAVESCGRDLGHACIVVQDSFAYIDEPPSAGLRSIDISNPLAPRRAGLVRTYNSPDDMVLRDSFLYLAEYARFEVVNIARPREPVLVGGCQIGTMGGAGISLQDSFAYVAGPDNGLTIVNIANPRNPRVVQVMNHMHALGCCVRDTLLFVGNYDDSLYIWNVRNPASPLLVSATNVEDCGMDIVLRGNYAYVGRDGLGVIDISDILNPRLIQHITTPWAVKKVVCDERYVYAALYDAGIGIYETTQVGINEISQVATAKRVWVSPNPTRGIISVAGVKNQAEIRIRDVTGRLVFTQSVAKEERVKLDIRRLSAGLYFLEQGCAGKLKVIKLIKQ